MAPKGFESDFAESTASAPVGLGGEEDAEDDESVYEDDSVGETLSGWLQKLQKGFSGKERWRRCWFVLSRGLDGTWTLSHYEHGTNMREFVGAERLAQGERKVAFVGNIRKILFVGNKGNKFEIVFKDGTPNMSLRAANEDVCKRWVYAILRLKDDMEKPAEPKPVATKPRDGPVSTYTQKGESGFADKRRERESLRVAQTFLKDSAVFMKQAEMFKQGVRDGSTIKRKGGTTLKRGQRNKRGQRGVESQFDSTADSEFDEVDPESVPPPPSEMAAAGYGGSDSSGDARGSGIGPGGRSTNASSEVTSVSTDGEFSVQTGGATRTTGFHEVARAEREASGRTSGSSGLFCFRSKPKPKRTAALPKKNNALRLGPHEDSAAATAGRKSVGAAAKAAPLRPRPPTEAEARAKAEALEAKAQDRLVNSGSNRKAKKEDEFEFEPLSRGAGAGSLAAAPRRGAATVIGDETLKRRAPLSGINMPKAKSGQVPRKKEQEGGPRMAVRPMARVQELPTGRVQIKSEKTSRLIKDTIEASISLSGMLFDDLDTHSMHDLVETMYRVDVKAGTNIIEQGDVGDSFFVIEKGKCHVYLKRDEDNALPELVAEKGPRTFFGELALLYEQPAPVTVRAVTNGVLWAIDRRQFTDIRKAQARKRQARKLGYLFAIDVLSEHLDQSALTALAEAMEERVYKKDDTILEAGAKLDKVLIVGSGRVDMLHGTELKAKLRRGDSFGEWALLERAAKSDMKLVAAEDRTTTLVLDVEEFEDLVGPLKETIQAHWQQSVQTMFPEEKTRTTKARGKGKASDADQFVRETLKLMKTKHLERQSSFTIDQGKKKSTAASTQPGGPASAGSGGVRLPSGMETDSDDDVVDSSDDEDDVVDDSKTAVDEEWEKPPLLCEGVTLDDVEPLERLGKGSFGRVHLVRNRGGITTSEGASIPNYMALKTLSREFIASNGWCEMVENERHAMAELSTSPYIVTLFAAFFDRKNIYFLMELCPGGDMYAQLRRSRGEPRLAEKDAKFYAACVGRGLEAVHANSIVYRDLKPENIFLGDDGYPKIADFGLAKKTQRTFTVCGTPEYMAPEIILGRGHDAAVDWWALGVFTFELICGASPFPGRSPMDVYEAVLAHQDDSDIKFPEHATFSRECKAFICALLNTSKAKRMQPVRRGFERHAFFQRFSFERLAQKKLKAPIKVKGRDFRKFEAANFKNRYNPRFKDPAVDRSGWEPSI